jgi:hypothetical protein
MTRLIDTFGSILVAGGTWASPGSALGDKGQFLSIFSGFGVPVWGHFGSIGVHFLW